MEQKFNPKDISLIAGLGNPGKEYAQTYHNVGALYLAHVVSLHAENPLPLEHTKSFAYAEMEKQRLVRPLVFMNESGSAVAAALKYFNKKPKGLLVVHDDSDLGLGAYKLSFGRGAAGHNGALSIMTALHTKNFWRLRIGIRLPSPEGKAREKASEFVLKKVNSAAMRVLETTFKEIDGVLFS